MADPVLDENLIIDLIETEPTPDSVMRLMAGATMLLVDAFDRRITRDAFVAIAHTALALHSYASQYGGVVNTRRLLRAGTLDDAVLTSSLDSATKLLEYHTGIALKQAHLLRECPLSTDKVQ